MNQINQMTQKTRSNRRHWLWGALGGVLLLILIGGWLVSYRPHLVVGPVIPLSWSGLKGGAPPRVKGMRLHVFNTGVNWVSSLLVGKTSKWRAVPAFVIEHPRQGLVVFDCGLGEAIAERGEGALRWTVRLLFKSRSKSGRLLDQQMKEAGLSPKKVKMVILSHLHFDHIGRASAFRDAIFVLGQGARKHDRSLDMGFLPALLKDIPVTQWRELEPLKGRPYATFDRAHDLFGDQSVWVIHGGGHAHNDLGLLVMLPGGPVLLGGDMVVHHPWLRGDDVQRIASRPARAAKVRNQIRALLKLKPQAILFPGHDLTEAPRHRDDIRLHHPEWFKIDAWHTAPL